VTGTANDLATTIDRLGHCVLRQQGGEPGIESCSGPPVSPLMVMSVDLSTEAREREGDQGGAVPNRAQHRAMIHIGPRMSVPSAPLRVAVVQMDSHLAFKDFLGEPLRNSHHLRELIERLPADSLLVDEIELLQQRVAQAYERGFLTRITAIMRFCGAHRADLVVFPEYSVPGTALPAIQALATEYGCTVVAGSHHVTADLLDDPGYSKLFTARPNRAVAPILFPTKPPLLQQKLFRSRWELDLHCDEMDFTQFTITPRAGRKPARVAVTICIDFLRHRDAAAARKHAKLVSKAHVIVVPAHSSADTTRDFESEAHNLYQTSFTSVAMANAASNGGSGIFGFGRDDVDPLMPNGKLPPLPSGREGICMAALQFDRPFGTKPNSLVTVPASEPLLYSVILPERDDPALAQLAHLLIKTPDVRSFRQLCRDQRDLLIQAAIHYGDAPLLVQRWQFLAKRAPACEDLDKLHDLASDLWLPDEVLTLDEIERQLTLGCLRVLRGFTMRAEASSTDRNILASTCSALEHVCAQRKWADAGAAHDLVADIASALLPGATTAVVASVHPDGSVEAWHHDAGPPPPWLMARGYRLWPVAAYAQILNDGGFGGPLEAPLIELQGYRENLDAAATWLALQKAPPAWIGRSPGGSAVLVVAPGHVVLVAPVLPSDVDLRHARSVAGLPLPVALILGDCSDLASPLERDVSALDQAIRQLAVDEGHLRRLAEYPYTPEGARFVPPMCQLGLDPKAPQVSAFTALNSWLKGDASTCVLCGALGDGRTTLLRSWLAPLARDALLGGGLPVYYLDCRSWRGHDHVAALFGDFTEIARAALRLAIATGNCLLVVDGMDDVLPAKILQLPFFAGWITEKTILLLSTCWRFNVDGAEHVRLCPAALEELRELKHNPGLVLQQPMPPRGFIVDAVDAASLEHPPGARMDAYLERHAEVFRWIQRDDAIDLEDSFIDLLEDLGHAIWTPRVRQEHTPATHIDRGRFAQHRARLHPGEHPPDSSTWKFLAGMAQRLIEFPPQSTGRTGAWLARQALRWVRTVRNDSPRDAENTLAIAWDAALQYALARKLVRCLGAGHSEILAILPLDVGVLAYCCQHHDWPTARTTLHILLRQPPATPLVTFNALALAASDGTIGSTAKDPWNLTGADLRSANLDGLHLDGAHLRGVSLRGASLRGTSLVGADLQDADLSGADLSAADLHGVVADRARLTGTILDGTVLRGARLRGADLSRSIAAEQSPDLSGADLLSVKRNCTDWRASQGSASDHADGAYASSIDGIIRSVLPEAHAGALVWSPDGHRLASSNAYGACALWSSGPIRCLRRWQEQLGVVRALAFSPDDVLLAIAGDHGVQLRRLEDLHPIAHLAHTAPVSGLYWEDAATLWTFADMPRRWDIARSKVLAEISELRGMYEGALVAEGRLLVVVPCRVGFSLPTRSSQLGILMWPSLEHLTQHHGTRLTAVDPTGATLLRTYQGHLFIYPLEDATVTPLHTIGRSIHDAHPEACHPTLVWSHDGSLLAVLDGNPAQRGAHVLCWDRAGHHRLLPPDVRTGHGLRFSPCDDRLAILDYNGLSVVDLTTGDLAVAPLPETSERWNSRISWTPTGFRLHGPWQIEDIDLRSAQIYRKSVNLPHDCMDVICDRRGDRFIYERAGTIVVWNATTRRQVTCHEPSETPTSHGGTLFSAFSHDEKFVLIQRNHGSRTLFDVWDSDTGEHRYHGQLPNLGSLILILDGSPAVFASCDGSDTFLIDPARQHLRSFPRSNAGRLYVAPSGELLVYIPSPNHVRCVRVVDLIALDTGRPLDDCDALWTGTVITNMEACAFDEAHGSLAVSFPGNVELRRLSNGEVVRTFDTGVAAGRPEFSPDGRHLAVLAFDVLQLWHLADGVLVVRLHLLRGGGLLLAGNDFQRLPLVESMPSLTGFYGQRSVDLLPLEHLLHLERQDLCSQIWQHLRSSELDNS